LQGTGSYYGPASGTDAETNGEAGFLAIAATAGAILIVCATLVSGSASTADLALRVAPKPRHEAPAAGNEHHNSVFEEFLRWKRTQSH
jgi:hypothetical protein